MKLLLFLFTILFFLVTPVLADSRSDFDYQYGKYRERFSEFLLYKKDYLSTPSLDNQQKALLTAKLSISTRDLTKASFAAYLRDLILLNNLNFPPLIPINKGLIEAQQYFLGEASKGQAIVTLADLDTFDKSYQNSYKKYESFMKLGVVSHKIAKLKNFSLKQGSALVTLKSKLPKNVSVRVTERLESLEKDLTLITEKIDSMANYLISEEGMDNSESEIFFSAKVDQLAEIRALQLDWIEQLIDLDLNYGKIWNHQPRSPKTHSRF